MTTWDPPSSPRVSAPGIPPARGGAQPGAAPPPPAVPAERPRGAATARHVVATVLGVGAVGAVVALASRAGGLPGDHDAGRAVPGELVPRVVLGVVVGCAVGVGLSFLFHLRAAPRTRSGRRRRFSRTLKVTGPLVALVGGFGALAGASTTPLRLGGATTRDAGFTLVARPVDADGDGRVDVDSAKRAILGLDLDSDGRVDRELLNCPKAAAFTAEQIAAARLPGAARLQVRIDTDCDGQPERIVYLDPRPAPLAADAIRPNQPSKSPDPLAVVDRGIDQMRGLLSAVAIGALVALAAAVVGGLVLALRGGRPRPNPRNHPVASGKLPIADPVQIDEQRAFEAFGESIDAMLTDADPRTGIIGAYARLLEGLGAAGIARRAEEAPLEHLRRSLEILQVPPAPLERLTELFVLARFSDHPMHEGHRLDALDALRAALGHLDTRRPAAMTGMLR